MIWIYILAAILAQAITVVLLISFIDRCAGKKKDTVESETAPATEKEEVQSPTPPQESCVGTSGFDYNQFLEMLKPVLEECIATAMDMRDTAFANTVLARMTPEQEQKAWEDDRSAEAALDKEEQTPAVENPLAQGATFDEIMSASVIVETPGEPTPEQHRFLVKVYHQLEGTEFADMMPDSMRERMYACHREAEANPDAFKEKHPETGDDILESPEPESRSANDATETTTNITAPASTEEGKPRRNYVPLSTFANPNKSEQ